MISSFRGAHASYFFFFLNNNTYSSDFGRSLEANFVSGKMWKCWAHMKAQTHTDMGQGTKDIPSRHMHTQQLLTVAQCVYCTTPQHLHDS